MRSSWRRVRPAPQVSLRHAGRWRLACLSLSLGTALYAGPPIAVDDQANTMPGTVVTIPVLANDQGAESNLLAILQVTAPSHGAVSVNPDGPVANAELSRLLQFAGAQLSNTVVKIGNTNQYPVSTATNGTWKTQPAGIFNWVSGYFVGSLWYLYEETGDTNYRTWAERWMGALTPMQYSTAVDDVGVMIYPSFGTGYRLTGNPAWRSVVLQTAASFATRYNGAARCLSTWNAITNAPFNVNIDTMMNLEVLFKAYDLGGSTNFHIYPRNHTEQTMLNHVRPDGGSYHIVTYDGNTGAVLFRGTYAGASNESTWARGHSWAIYGFTMAFRETGDPRFLDTAQRTADYYLTNVPSDYVPYWDFQAPNIPNEPRDSSAAAVTLAALVDLSQATTNLQFGAKYWLAARHLLDSLGSTNYLAQGSVSSGILLHGVGETPPLPNPEIDVSLIYGDYYFIEALRRYAETYRRRTIRYTPNPGFQGTDAFAYQLCDSAGNCSTAAVTVVVEPAGPGPFAAHLSFLPGTTGPTVSFPSTAGRTYQVEYVNDLPAPGSWNILASNLDGSGLPMSISDTNPPAHRFYRVGIITNSLPGPGETIAATSGTVTAPFIVTNNDIYQPFQTIVVAVAGKAAYDFNIPSAGNYVIQTLVNAPTEAANSFFVNVDAEPQDPAMIWDIPVTSGYAARTVSWRGNGTPSTNQFVPKIFTLTQGSHQLIIRGREADTRLRSLSLMPYP
jgi:hypothetical protein